MARTFKSHSKMTPKRPSEVKKLMWGKVDISSAMREELQDLEKT